MLSTEVQESIVTNAFFEELSKSASFGTWLKGRAAGWKSYTAHSDVAQAVSESAKADEQVLKARDVQGKAEKHVRALMSEVEGMPRHLTSEEVKNLKNSNKNTKTLATAAAALGLGGLGFGYHQLKERERDQFARSYPQVG